MKSLKILMEIDRISGLIYVRYLVGYQIKYPTD